MKTGVTILMIAVLVLGGIFYLILPKDNCASVNCNDNNLCTADSCSPDTGACSNIPKTCPEGQECNPGTGGCEVIQEEANALDRIEQAVSDKVKTEGQSSEQTADAMDKIENSIKKALGK